MTARRFLPSRDGLPFANSFPVRLGPLRTPWTYGLCGGMCFAALDRFLAGSEADAPPPRHVDLWQRQLHSLGWPRRGLPDSLAALPLLRCLAWQLQSDRTRVGDPRSLASRTRRVWPEIAARLDAGIPVALCLVRARPWQAPWINHQVLATDYDVRGGGVQLRVYDPNFPGQDDVTIHVRLAGPWQIRQSHTRHRLRAFFPVPSVR